MVVVFDVEVDLGVVEVDLVVVLSAVVEVVVVVLVVVVLVVEVVVVVEVVGRGVVDIGPSSPSVQSQASQGQPSGQSFTEVQKGQITPTG